MSHIIQTVFLTTCIFFFSCQSSESGADLKIVKKNENHIELSKKLREISGIAFDNKGRLFAHDDERAVIYELNPQNGEIIKLFSFGLMVKRGDFEDIAIAGETFYMVTSNGVLYRFNEGSDKARVEYDTFRTDLHSNADVEGLCYDPESDALLLALKGNPGSGLDPDKKKAVYSFSLKTMKLDPEPRFVLDIDTITDESKEDDFAPSAIAYNAWKDRFYVIAAVGNVIVELNRAGEILSIEKLSHKLHDQPEGIDFPSKNVMYISDEGKKHGTLTFYETE